MDEIVIGDWSKLGSTVRAQRLRLEFSQAEAAARARVSRSWLAKVESGHRGVELEQLMRLLAALGLTMVFRASNAPEAGSDQHLTDRRLLRAANRRRAWYGDEEPSGND
ncbi:helix-turn-helix domain-containing protein [Kribbella solani]|uniref:Transcriptional regulator with XRE-family HTH domain n=1 Tax=Kribbella solani TaxID=236067 RepID=A0A841E2G2_9ACTN|nr:helix-turn-helix transcriptional regulator [Kribbella solani]MBB5981568.1 transcriptional regulator with XRE-family HTH domain [Kribbella solani]